MLPTQDEIRFLIQGVCVCRHLGSGFSPFPLHTSRQPLRGGWIRGQWVWGDTSCERHTPLFLGVANSPFRLVSSTPTLLALPSGTNAHKPWGPAREKVYVFVREESREWSLSSQPHSPSDAIPTQKLRAVFITPSLNPLMMSLEGETRALEFLK